MYDYEKEIVNNNFINRKDTYNIALGGQGGNLGIKWYENFIYGNKHKKYTKDEIVERIKIGQQSVDWNKVQEKIKITKKKNNTEPSSKNVIKKQLKTKVKNNTILKGKNHPMYGKKSYNYLEYDKRILTKIKEYFDIGLTDREMSKIFSLSRNKIRRIFKEIGLVHRTYSESRKIRSKNKIQIAEVIL